MKTTRNLLLATTALVLLVPGHAAAQGIVWDSDPGTAGVQAGNGNWNTADNNWIESGTTQTTFSNGDAVIFEGAGGTVTVNIGSVSPDRINFTGTGYEIAGGDISGIAQVRISAGQTNTISAALTGGGPTQNILVVGGGTLVLTGANTTTSQLRVSNGTVQMNGGSYGGGVRVLDTLNVTGTTIAGELEVRDGSTVTLAGGGQVGSIDMLGGSLSIGATTLNAASTLAGGSVTFEAGTTTGDISNNGATLTIGDPTAVLDGLLTERSSTAQITTGTGNLTDYTIDGSSNLTTSGAGLSILGDFTQSSSTVVTISTGDTLSALFIENEAGSGGITLGAGATLEGRTGPATSLDNAALITVGDGGEITGAGGLENRDTGTITFNADGTLTADSDTTGNEGIQNFGILNVNGGSATTVTVSTGGTGTFQNQTDGVINIMSGGNLDVTGVGSPGLSNTGTGVINMNGSSIIGDLDNNNVVNIGGSVTLDGNVSGGGTFDLTQNGAPGDSLEITGTLTGANTFVVDVVSGSGTADTIMVDGTGVDAGQTINFVDSGIGLQATPVDIIIADTGSTIDPADFSIGTFASSGTAVAQLVQNGDNLAYQITGSLAIGGLVGGVTSTSALLNAVVNRPVQPFVASPGFDISDGACRAGGWGRVLGGEVEGLTSTTSPSDTADAETTITYTNFSLGTDVGCFDGTLFDGWNIAGGVVLAFGTGNMTTVVPTLLPGAEATTTGSFDHFGYGFYATGISGRWLVDGQLTFSNAEFVYDNPGIDLTDQSVNVDSVTLTVAARYTLPLSTDGLLVFVPGGGVSVTQTDYGTLNFDTAGDTLDIEDRTSTTVFASGTLARTWELRGGNAIGTLDATLAGYSDLSDDITSTLMIGGSTETSTTTSLGTYGEVSIGFSYSSLLNLESGPRQLDANIRGDVRFGDNVEGYGLTAEVRFQF